jgi:hypothetical protein
MYRLDTRGGTSYSGFATTTSWTSWNAPSSGFVATANAWYKLTIVIPSSSSVTLYYSQTTDSSPQNGTFGTQLGTYGFLNKGGYIGLVGDAAGSSYSTWWDNIIVRKYASPEPTTSIGAEDVLITQAGSPTFWQWKVPSQGEKVRHGNAINWTWIIFSLPYLSDYSYRRAISISNPGPTLTEYHINLTLDTQSLISAGKMQSDCDDIRFTDSDGSTLLSYWLESGCNSASTKIWVNVPYIPANSTKTIYLYYGNPYASSASLSWSGTFIMPFNASCPAGWTRFTALDGRFPQGSPTPGGTGGGNHTHTISGTTGGPSDITAYSSGEESASTSTHTHPFSATTSAKVDLPLYYNVTFCYKTFTTSPDTCPANMIGMFNTSVLPSGWTRFTALDGRFPQGSPTPGGTGGDTGTHNHTATITTSYYWSAVAQQTAGTGETTVPVAHTHTFTITTSSNSTPPPPYYNVTYGIITTDSQLPAGLIGMFNSSL